MPQLYIIYLQIPETKKPHKNNFLFINPIRKKVKTKTTMAKLKMQKYGKKPKATASVSTMENYIVKCREIDKENAKRKALNSKKEVLRKKISGIKQKI